MTNEIIVKGAREHNLKNVDVRIPKNKLVVCTGVSGSGKSSFAMDTLYAEGQRRFIESLSAYARQFLGRIEKPDVEYIEGLSPAIAIEQKTVSRNPRSTVGTVTEIYDYLRLLFARVGHPHCPKCGAEIAKLSVDQIVDRIKSISSNHQNYSKSRGIRILILSPIIKEKKGEFTKIFDNLKRDGYQRVRVDGHIRELNNDFVLIKTNRHTIDVVVDRFIVKNELSPESLQRMARAVETALKTSNGYVILSIVGDSGIDFPDNPALLEDHLFSEQFSCPYCNISLPEIEPRLFSFNSPIGACSNCHGLGSIPKIDQNIIMNPKLSILEGGLFPWSAIAEKDTWRLSVLKAVSIKNGISLERPLEQLNKDQLQMILYGTGDETYEVTMQDSHGLKRLFNVKYEGLIPNLERRHEQTDSDFIRNEIEKFMVREACQACAGRRLNEDALSITINESNISKISDLPITELLSWIKNIKKNNILNNRELAVAQGIIKEIENRLDFLLSVGLNYLTLSRSSATLAGGESQRIRLASQIGSGLSGVLYVLDEPSIGLHDRDQAKLIATLKKLRDLGNTVIVVEHDLQTILESDRVIDFGPGAGIHGGYIIAEGTPQEIMNNKKSITGPYLNGTKKVYVDNILMKKITEAEGLPDLGEDRGFLKILGASGHNLKNIDVDIPIGKLTCVTGVSGSGKSTLVNETLLRRLRQEFGLKNDERPLPVAGVLGMENFRNVIAIDQSPIGRTPRSNPATYTGVFDHIRELFSMTNDSKIRGYNTGRFSFNVKGGRCEACQGEGQLRIEMQFLPDVFVDCEVCQGKKYNRDTLDIEYKNKNIADVLDLTVEDALNLFGNVPRIEQKLRLLTDVGLGYITLGQSAPTLSGGEAQRIKLASELSKRSSKETLYILDEPTTGLHFADLQKLLGVIKLLVTKGSTVVVVEHNLDVIGNADWIIDLGLEGGNLGGDVVYMGLLKDFYQHTSSYTASSLRQHQKYLNPGQGKLESPAV